MVYLMIIFLCLMPVGVFAMGSMRSSVEKQASSGQLAAEFTLPTISGKNLSLTQVREGKKAILFLWATWCPHCHEELERVRQNIDKIKAKGIQIILINSAETKQEAAGYLKHQDIPLDSFLDENNDVASLYNVEGLPTLFFIDEKGIVRNVEHGLPSNYETLFQ